MRRQSHLRWYVLSFFVTLVALWSAGGPGKAYWQSSPEHAPEASPSLSQSPSPGQEATHPVEGAKASAREEEHGESGSAWDVLEKLAGSVDAPEDWAAEHDQYLYGMPKGRTIDGRC